MSAFRMNMGLLASKPATAFRSASSSLPLATRTSSSSSSSSSSMRSFHTARVLFAGKETKPGTEDPEARKAEIEEHKHAQLRAQKEGRNEWKEAIASESESITKADRGELKTDKGSIKELQEESVKAAQKERK